MRPNSNAASFPGAGALAIGVAWGYHEPHELRAAGADAVVDRFADRLPAMEGVLHRRRDAPQQHRRDES